MYPQHVQAAIYKPPSRRSPGAATAAQRTPEQPEQQPEQQPTWLALFVHEDKHRESIYFKIPEHCLVTRTACPQPALPGLRRILAQF